MKVLAISGSLRRDSLNTRLLKASAGLLPPGSELELFERLAEIAPYSEDDEHSPPPAVVALKDTIASADAVLFATPEYNGSIPGQLKNALDWVSRPRASTPLAGKAVAVVGASKGIFGAVWAQAELRKVLSTIGARVLERDLPIAQAHEALDDDGLPSDPDARRALQEILSELAELAQPLLAVA
jgi:chromate reductase, NAD(P)H dehydrogenase (quinone)